MSQTVITTTMSAGFAGQLDGMDHDIATGIQAEASAEMPFGAGVVRASGGDDNVKLPSAVTDNVRGVISHSHVYDKDQQLGTVGVKPKNLVNVVRRGRIRVKVEEAVVPGDRAYLRYAGSGDKGAWRKSAVPGETIDCTAEAEFQTTAGVNGFAILDVDFTNS